jgi:DNA-binding NtrC family response regulator
MGMAIENGILLISKTADSTWLSVVAAASARFGPLDIVPLQEALDLLRQQPRQMIIVDAADFDDPPRLVTQIRAVHPGARVVVATASPTWRRAREAFQAGATDYIRKSLSIRQLQEALSGALEKTPPRQRGGHTSQGGETDGNRTS